MTKTYQHAPLCGLVASPIQHQNPKSRTSHGSSPELELGSWMNVQNQMSNQPKAFTQPTASYWTFLLCTKRRSRTSDPCNLPWRISESARHSASAELMADCQERVEDRVEVAWKIIRYFKRQKRRCYLLLADLSWVFLSIQRELSNKRSPRRWCMAGIVRLPDRTKHGKMIQVNQLWIGIRMECASLSNCPPSP